MIRGMIAKAKTANVKTKTYGMANSHDQRFGGCRRPKHIKPNPTEIGSASVPNIEFFCQPLKKCMKMKISVAMNGPAVYPIVRIKFLVAICIKTVQCS